MRGYLTINNNLKEKFFDLCFNSYWKENIDLSNVQNINHILNECLINKKTFFYNIENQKIKEELKKLTNDAFEKDVFGAPTFIVNNKIFWGQDRLDYALDEYGS